NSGPGRDRGGQQQGDDDEHGPAQPGVLAEEAEQRWADEKGEVPAGRDGTDPLGAALGVVAGRGDRHGAPERRPEPPQRHRAASAATVTPTAPHSALADSTAARPNRTRTGPPANRPTVIATAKPA